MLTRALRTVRVNRKAPIYEVVSDREERDDEADASFEFGRTISRLMETQSEDYLTRGHGKTIAS